MKICNNPNHNLNCPYHNYSNNALKLKGASVFCSK